MIYFVLVVSTAAFFFARAFRKILDERDEKEGWRYWLARSAQETLLPVVLVAVALSVIDVDVSTQTTDSVTLQTMHKLEHRLADLQKCLKYFKLTPGWSFLLLAVVFLANVSLQRAISLQSARRKLNRLFKWYSAYHKWIGTAANVVAFVGAFTLLGPVVADRGRVELAIKRTSDDYHDFRDQIRGVLTVEAARAITHRVLMVHPLAAEAERRCAEAEQHERELLSKVASERLEPTLSAPSAKEPLEAMRLRDEALRRTELRAEGAAKGATVVSVPVEASTKKIKESSAEISILTQKLRVAAAVGKETGYLERIIKSAIKLGFEPSLLGLDKLTGEVPLFKPIISIFTDTVTGRLTQMINERANRLASEEVLTGGEERMVEKIKKAAVEIEQMFNDHELKAASNWETASAAAEAELQSIRRAKNEYDSAIVLAKIRKRTDLELRLRAECSKFYALHSAHLERTNPRRETSRARKIRQPKDLIADDTPLVPWDPEVFLRYRDTLDQWKPGAGTANGRSFSLADKLARARRGTVSNRAHGATASLSGLADEIIVRAGLEGDLDAQCRLLANALIVLQSSEALGTKLVKLSATLTAGHSAQHTDGPATSSLHELARAEKASESRLLGAAPHSQHPSTHLPYKPPPYKPPPYKPPPYKSSGGRRR